MYKSEKFNGNGVFDQNTQNNSLGRLLNSENFFQDIRTPRQFTTIYFPGVDKNRYRPATFEIGRIARELK